MNRLECYQAASVAFNTWACNGITGRPKTDPVYQRIVEGRDVPATYEDYSSCADRCHAWLWLIGCERKFVNREERSPLPRDWHIGVNISNLHNLALGSPCLSATNSKGEHFAVAPGADWEPSVGDELLSWNKGNDAHSFAIISYEGSRAVTANYGVSGCSKAVFPGAKVGNAPLVFKSGHWWYGEGVHAKQVQRVLRLVDYIETLTRKANLDGIPFDDAYTGEVRDFIENERA
jgi:hypothetical protein